MPGLFDSIFKEFLLQNPNSLLRLLNLPTGESVSLENTDLSASSRSADILLNVSNPDYLVHIEMQTSYDHTMPKRMLEYRILCGLRGETMPEMVSVLLLMRPQAHGSALSGLLELHDIKFTYHVIRLWEMDVESVLSQPVHMLPLAPLCAVPDQDLPFLINRMQERLSREYVAPSECREIWAKTRLLLGLKMSKKHAEALMGGIMLDLKDSTTYMATLEEGIQKGIQKGREEGKLEGKLEGLQEGKLEGKLEGGLEEGRRVLLRLGQKRLGAASSDVLQRIEAISDVEQIESLIDRVLDVESWNELLG